MPDIDYNEIIKKMLDASKTILSKHWKETKPYAEKEFKNFAENLKMIAALKLKGEITEEQAKLHVEIQKNSIRIVFLAIQGLGILTVESAINAAIGIIKDTVNSTLGWEIL